MNPATAGLLRAALLAMLGWSAVLVVLAQFGLGSRYALHPDDPEAMAPLPQLELSRAVSQLAPFSEYGVVAERPLFNPDLMGAKDWRQIELEIGSESTAGLDRVRIRISFEIMERENFETSSSQ